MLRSRALPRIALLLGAVSLLWIGLASDHGSAPRESAGPAGAPSTLQAEAPTALAPAETGAHPGNRVRQALAPKRPFQIRVRTHFGAKADPVAGVGVVFGLLDERSNRRALAQMRAGEILGRAVSDEAGDCVLALPELAGETRLWAAVDHPGMAWRPSWTDPAEAAEALVVQGRPGFLILGEVVDSEGEPVQGGSVVAYCQDPSRGPRRGGSSEIGRQGWFQLLPNGEAPDFLLAKCPGTGSGGLAGIELPSGTGVVELRIELQPGSVIAGRLFDPHGDPIRAYDLRASAVRDRNPDRAAESAAVFRLSLDEGLLEERVTTRDDGSFRFEGLRPGRFRLRGRNPAMIESSRGYRTRSKPFDLAGEPVPTGMTEIELVLPLHRIEVQVRDAGGDPRECWLHSTLSRTVWQAELAVPAITCWKLGPGGEPMAQSWADQDFDHGTAEDHTLVLFVEAGFDYAVGLFSPDAPWQERILPVADGNYLQRVVFDAPAGPAGKLVVRPRTPEGAPLQGYYRVRVFDASGSRELAGTGRNHAKPTFETGLGPGSWRVHLLPAPSRGIHGGRGREPRYAGVETVVVLEAGEHKVLDLRVAAAGRLELQVLAGTEPDRERWPGQEDWFRFWASLGFWKNAASVRLLGPKGEEVVPVFEMEWDGRGPVSYDEVDWIEIGQSARSLDPIPVGSYRLLVRAPGFPPLERPVEIADGRTTSVTVELAVPEPEPEPGQDG